MDSAEIVWAGIILAGVSFEAYALANRRNGDTLSEVTRSAFRVKTSKVGRAVFASSWAAFSVWFAGHILYGWPFPLT